MRGAYGLGIGRLSAPSVNVCSIQDGARESAAAIFMFVILLLQPKTLAAHPSRLCDLHAHCRQRCPTCPQYYPPKMLHTFRTHSSVLAIHSSLARATPPALVPVNPPPSSWVLISSILSSFTSHFPSRVSQATPQKRCFCYLWNIMSCINIISALPHDARIYHKLLLPPTVCPQKQDSAILVL